MKARAIWVAAAASVTIGVVLLLSGCAAPGGIRRPETISMPVSLGWYNGERVYYITTDITDPPMARGAGVNLALRMRDAIPTYPKPPGQKDVLERVYKFPNGEQDAVFASIPNPVGPFSSWMRSTAHCGFCMPSGLRVGGIASCFRPKRPFWRPRMLAKLRLRARPL